MNTKNSSLLTILTLCLCSASSGALAQNLVLNPIFNQGNTGGVPVNWSQNGGGNYNYADSTSPDFVNGGEIWSFGWWDGAAIWQNTSTTILASENYQLSVVADVGQAPLTGLLLSFQDVTKGWTTVASQDFPFTVSDQTSGQYETFTLNIPQTSLASLTGDTIGVGVALSETPNTQYGWVHFDQVSLVTTSAVPEPTSLAQVGTGLAGVAFMAGLGLKRAKFVRTDSQSKL